ncbi:MAG: D-alanyl-D-alanine carboxypeptidase family protein [Bacillota bacterium]
MALILALSSVPVSRAEPPVLETTAESAVLMDPVTGNILYEKNPDKKLPPASVTKVMTLLVALEALEKGKVKLTDQVVTSENAWKMGGSQIYLEPGETMSLETMLISIAVGSANDACVAVAEHIAGSLEGYVQLMNDKAKELGCKNTHFVNDYGLPAEGHYTSARDLAIMMRETLKYPLFKKLTSIKHYDLRDGKFVLHNTNKLLWWYKGVDGGKTGWTTEAKYCLASTAERDGLRLIAVVMATPEPKSHFRESMKLYNYGFSQFEATSFAKKHQVIGAVQVHKGTVDQVHAVTENSVGAVVPKGSKKSVKYSVKLDKLVTAPVQRGQKLGTVTVIKDGRELFAVNLVAEREVPKGNVFRHIKKIFRTTFTFNK